MQNITSATELRNAIQLLEIEQANKERLLKEQFYLTYEGLKPISLIMEAFGKFSSSPNLIDNILGTTAGLVTGYLSKKIFTGTSNNMFRKLFGSILQLGVTNVIAKHPDAIKSVGQFIIQRIFRKRESNSQKP